MSSEYEGLYSPEILGAYQEVRQFTEIPIDLFVTQFWDKGHDAHVRSASEANRANPYEGSSDELADHRKKMERIAVAKVSALLASKKHEHCKEIMRNKEHIGNTVVSALANMPGCHDPISVLRSHDIAEPEQQHLNVCQEISDSIIAIWDNYKQKRINVHQPDKFRQYFLEKMKNAPQLVAARKERKLRGAASPTPGLKSALDDSDMPLLRKVSSPAGSYGATSASLKIFGDSPAVGKQAPADYDDMPALRRVGQQQAPADYGDMPALRRVGQQAPISDASMPQLKKIGSDVDVAKESISFEAMPRMRKIGSDAHSNPSEPAVDAAFNSDDDEMPALREAASYSKVGSPQSVAAGMPQLHARPSQRLAASNRQGSTTGMPALRNLNSKPAVEEKVVPKVNVDWMKQYIQKNRDQLELKNYIYFAPSDQRKERVLKALQATGQEESFNPDSFVATHLCSDFQPTVGIENNAFKPLRGNGEFLVLVNKEGKIERPAVPNSALIEAATVTVDDISVRVFVHNNLFNFSK